MFYLSGISITFFLSLLLWSKKNKSLADKILGVWLVVIGIHLIIFYQFSSGMSFQYPELLGVGFPVPLLHGPFLFLYVAALTGRTLQFRKFHLLHFSPVIATYLYLIPFFLLPPDKKIYIFQHNGIGYEAFQLIIFYSICLSGIVYVTLTTRLYLQHKKNILDQFSYTEKINLDWIMFLITGIGLIWILVMFTNDTWVHIGAVLYVLFLGYFGIKQVGIFTTTNGDINNLTPLPTSDPIPELEFSQNTIQQPDSLSLQNSELVLSSNAQSLLDNVTGLEKKKYQKSGLTAETAQKLHLDLQKLMQTEKVFKQSELSLAELAGMLNTLPNYLSQVINDKEGKSFFDYINTLRIEEFITLISDPSNKKFTLLALAYECGFNSKSSFNKYFKKIKGESPSEYLEKLK